MVSSSVPVSVKGSLERMWVRSSELLQEAVRAHFLSSILNSFQTHTSIQHLCGFQPLNHLHYSSIQYPQTHKSHLFLFPFQSHSMSNHPIMKTINDQCAIKTPNLEREFKEDETINMHISKASKLIRSIMKINSGKTQISLSNIKP